MVAPLRGVPHPSDEENARMRIHRIASEVMSGFGCSSKLNAEWDFPHCCMTKVEKPLKTAISTT